MAAAVLLTAAALRKLLAAKVATRRTATRAALRAGRALVVTMGDEDWRDATAITRFAQTTAKVVEPHQRQVAAVTNAFHARVLTGMTGTTVSPVRQIDVSRLRGIDHDAEFGRIADHYRWLTSEGKTPAEAGELAKLRLEQVVEMDIALADRAQSRANLSVNKKVRYYRRVIHPERATVTHQSCGLCIAASDRTYNKKDLMPIHFRCNCEPVPITDETADLGYVLNQEHLDQLYEDAGGNTRDKLKKTRYSIHQHGELGPVLTYQGDRFRGPAVVADDTTGGKPAPTK